MLLEVVLQAAALVAWSASDQVDAGDADGRRTAICIGDSFTYGLHASSPAASYPAQAQRDVAARSGAAWRFLNCGIPGQTSRDVLQRLPQLLRQHRPEVIYLLVGTNDYFFRPDALRAEELATEAPGFPWRWRTLRLVQLGIGARSAAAVDAARPFLGLWHNAITEFEFLADGMFRMGDKRWRWMVDDDGALRLLIPGGHELPLDWRTEGQRLWIEASIFEQPHLLEPGPLPGPLTEVLHHHLELAASLCSAAGSRLVLLNYPPGKYAPAGLNDALRLIASALDLDQLDVARRFEDLAETEALDAYFVTDGHCSDIGYGEIAKLVAAHVRRLQR